MTVRALKTHSGRYGVAAGRPLPPEMLAECPEDVRAGAANLRKHLQIVRSFGMQPVVAINAFPTDHDSEHAANAAGDADDAHVEALAPIASDELQRAQGVGDQNADWQIIVTRATVRQFVG